VTIQGERLELFFIFLAECRLVWFFFPVTGNEFVAFLIIDDNGVCNDTIC